LADPHNADARHLLDGAVMSLWRGVNEGSRTMCMWRCWAAADLITRAALQAPDHEEHLCRLALYLSDIAVFGSDDEIIAVHDELKGLAKEVGTCSPA
jgi:hypothetical protein